MSLCAPAASESKLSPEFEVPARGLREEEEDVGPDLRLLFALRGVSGSEDSENGRLSLEESATKS